ncbi:MAG TPA: BatA domain-containing protein, partial [Gemmata sp.]|nr:BatA domain-containing protein [Gemmata sp.]
MSTPIIIHLINRMRFRRVKWAAMEFLLKAQKKMRRKKILEQLLLLLLRCLLVFLAGLLFARFLGLNPEEGKETRPVVHVVILDNTTSMADVGGTDATTDAFAIAKQQITDKIIP